ncbi:MULTISPECIES: threonine dehydratase [unclassified Nocardioides]|uniref:threonine dehydratase n=1 Tax=unclassified Nocardioides TaxID=2615069 RepID=UPI000A8D8E59|nr:MULTISPECIES: threonine dehydratase [unclassified Nocardioides]
MNDVQEDRRRQQAELYGDPIDVLANKVQHLMGLGIPELAEVIGLSVPMLTKLLTAERVGIGNNVAMGRLTRLQEFTSQLISGEASRDEIQLTLAQIKASTTPARPSRVTAVAKATPTAAQQDTSPRRPMIAPGTGERPLITPTSLGYARSVVGRHVKPTPAYRWPLLERFTRTETWVKHENHSPTGAFKVRGGLNFLERLRVSGMPAPSGLISATRGNHGQSLAFAGSKYGVPITIVVPRGNNPDQSDSMDGLGAEVIEHGDDFQEAREYAARLAGERTLLMVPPFHAWLVEGVATYAAELHESVPGLEAIYVPIGMGSGACANILVRDLLGLRTEIIGVVAAGAPAYALSYEAGRPVSTDSADTFVDGAACRTPDPIAVDIINRGISRIVRVSEEEAAEAMALTYRTTHNLAEPAGSLALAGMLADTDRPEGRKTAIVQTGGNCDLATLSRVTTDVV